MKWAYTDDDIIMLFLRAKKQQKQIIVLANLCGVSKRTIMNGNILLKAYELLPGSWIDPPNCVHIKHPSDRCGLDKFSCGDLGLRFTSAAISAESLGPPGGLAFVRN